MEKNFNRQSKWSTLCLCIVRVLYLLNIKEIDHHQQLQDSFQYVQYPPRFVLSEWEIIGDKVKRDVVYENQ
jgi:hypothetical protein